MARRRGRQRWSAAWYGLRSDGLISSFAIAISCYTGPVLTRSRRCVELHPRVPAGRSELGSLATFDGVFAMRVTRVIRNTSDDE